MTGVRNPLKNQTQLWSSTGPWVHRRVGLDPSDAECWTCKKWILYAIRRNHPYFLKRWEVEKSRSSECFKITKKHRNDQFWTLYSTCKFRSIGSKSTCIIEDLESLNRRRHEDVGRVICRLLWWTGNLLINSPQRSDGPVRPSCPCCLPFFRSSSQMHFSIEKIVHHDLQLRFASSHRTATQEFSLVRRRVFCTSSPTSTIFWLYRPQPLAVL